MAEKHQVPQQQHQDKPPEQAPQAQPPGLAERFTGWVKENKEQQPKVSGQIAAMFREAVKDIRNTMNETFFGRGEHPPEMGTPGNPTPQSVTAEQGNFHGYNAASNDNRSYGQTLADTAQQAQEQQPRRSQGI